MISYLIFILTSLALGLAQENTAAIDGWKIKDRLIQPMESCKYCGEDESFKWGLSKEPVDKMDWCL